ncbi:MAG: hypothetical protein R3362_06600 [Rhodothermales bacterium]|nr:hypothetical protein [Rhodothermales bacterium]
MTATLVFFLCVLLVAGVVLVWEARTGRLAVASVYGEAGRATLFFLAAVAGGALLFRVAPNNLLLASALIPVTALSLFRFVMLARQRWQGLVAATVLAAVLLAGVSLGLTALPDHIDERFFLEHVLHGDTGPLPQSIDPAAHRSVRT